MEFSELVKLRQSDRKYLGEPVERKLIQKCIETARLSPSANNSQPWKLVIVDDVELKNEVAGCAAGPGMNKFAKQAPVMIAVVLEKMGLLSTLGSVIKDKEYSLLDVGIMVNQFCLQAAELGLGTCIMGWFDEGKVKELLGITRGKRVPLLISLGYPDPPTREKTRKTVDEISSWNKY